METEWLTPLLSTKLALPPVRRPLVARPRLMALLDGGLEGVLTLVSAPAGFGKTTLLSQWLQSLGRPVAWISLDAEDNHPRRFLRYLLTALYALEPALKNDALSLLRAPDPPPLSVLLTHLLNDLAQLSQPAILVLDDYHHVRDATIHQGIVFLLEHLPSSLHLVIATREDPSLPLARLRARRQLSEVRATHLRFLPEESATLMHEIMGVSLSGADIATLVGRTEGWVVGLQLAALSLRESEDIAASIADFAGTHRFVMDYLVEEVLEQQASVVQLFLLRTSLLGYLCAPLCDRVLGQTESHHILQALSRANLFLLPTDDQQRWYRYHPLFADLLRHRLRERLPHEIAELHRRAAQWYVEEGFLAEAIQHSLEAGDHGTVVALLECHGERMWTQGEHLTLRRWLEALPEVVRRSSTTLMLLHAWTLATLYPTRHEPVETILQVVSQGLEGSADATGVRGMVAVVRSALASNQANPARTRALSLEALRQLPEEKPFWRLIPFINLGAAHSLQGEIDEAETALAEAIRLADRADNPYSALVAMRILADARFLQGRLHAAAALHDSALHLVSMQGWARLAYVSTLYLSVARLAYEWNDLERTRQELEKVVQTDGLENRPLLLLARHSLGAWLERAVGNEQASGHHLRQIEEMAPAPTVPFAQAIRCGYLARLRLAQGQIEEAATLVDQARVESEGAQGSLREVNQLISARVLIAQGRWQEARAMLDELLERAMPGSQRTIIESLLVRSWAWQREGRLDDAIVDLRQALTLAEPEGYVRLFLDGRPWLLPLLDRLRDGQTSGRGYLTHLLAAGGRAAPLSSGLADPLSPRELEVLRLIAEGLSNREIGSRLFLATSTVKWYTNIMYSKLQVRGRIQAVARARELGFLVL